MAASTAGTWRESGVRAERRAPARATRPGADEHVARVPRPPVPPLPPRAGAARPMRSTDIPPLPEHLARIGRGPSDEERPMARSAAVRPSEPGRSERRPAERTRRPAEREDLDARRRTSRPAEARAASREAAAPEHGRLRGAVAVLAVFLVTLVAASLEAALGSGLGLITLVALGAITAVATLLVRRRDLLSVVVAPPLVYVAAAAIATALFGAFSLAGVATMLIRGFPAMAVGTGAGLVVALIRWAARR
ncbi:DUF6542 domain-containing protein [Geodermatophilus sp. SYSU D01105]